jgi:hypothetical protein
MLTSLVADVVDFSVSQLAAESTQAALRVPTPTLRDLLALDEENIRRSSVHSIVLRSNSNYHFYASELGHKVREYIERVFPLMTPQPEEFYIMSMQEVTQSTSINAALPLSVVRFFHAFLASVSQHTREREG